MRPLHTLFILTAVLSQGATVTLTTLLDWQAAGPQSGIVDFESTTSGNAASFVLNGLTFSSTDPGNPWLNVGNHGIGTGKSLRGPGGTEVSLTILLPANVYRLGFGLVNYSPSNPSLSGGVTLLINNVVYSTNLATGPVSPGPINFYSISDSIPITSITITSNNFYMPYIDNVVWGSNEAPPAETPETSTAILIGTSLLLLPTLRRRFLRSASTTQQQLAH